jgi:tRNA 2-selenouridine synthase
MTAPRLIGIEDLPEFDAVIDVRSPSEFADDHIPRAINLPVLDDAERARVGALYASAPFDARRVGAALVAAHLDEHLRGALADKPPAWRPLVNCWRGGMRSGAMVQVMRMVGWDAQPLAGGYRTWRRHVLARIEADAPRLPLRVVCGATGSAKTRVLHALAGQGAQVLDLEALARHKGSVLGGLPGAPQPSQKLFETGLVDAMGGFDFARPVFVEAESRRIGRLNVPTALVERMRAAPCRVVAAPRAARVAYLLRDYAWLREDPATLASWIGQLKGLQSNATLERWCAWAHAGEHAALVDELLALHYDPQYAKSQQGHFLRLAEGTVFDSAALDDADLQALAQRILGAD